MAGKSLKFSETIAAPIEHVYRAVSTSTGFQEWFCKRAEVDVKKLKMVLFWFEKVYHVGGTVLKTVPDQEVVFSWQGLGDPNPTEVQIVLDDQGDNVGITVEHSGFTADPAWEGKLEAIEKMWKDGLRALKAVLETGINPLIYEKPMLGILLGDMVNPKLAANKNLPVDYGLILGGVLNGMGAEAAGLRKDDLVAEVDGIKIKELADLTEAMSPYGVGDQIEMVYFRGDQRQVVRFPLTTYPLPDVPETAQGLSEAISAIYSSANAKMDELFSGITEMQAEFRLKQGEWNSKEVLAHLLLGERDMYNWVSSILTGWEVHLYTSLLSPRIKSVVAAHPTLPDLTNTLVKTQDEGVALLAELPADFVARKSTYTRVAANLLMDTPAHYKDHMEQIADTLAAAEQLN